jgi:preprotein translocase subunit Sec63
MKRTFYEMLGVPHDADQAQIDSAYASLTQKLGATTSMRGTTETMTELTLIREGYKILSDQKKRAMYDAKLHAAETGVQLMFFPEGATAHKKLGVEAVIFAVLASVLTYVVYQQFARQVDTVRFEHVQAVTRHVEEQNKAVSLEEPRANPPDVKVIITEDAKRSGPEVKVIAKDEEKRSGPEVKVTATDDAKRTGPQK